VKQPDPDTPSAAVAGAEEEIGASSPRRILIVSDAWQPQVNGVVRTLSAVAGELSRMGHVVDVIGPDRFRSIACPTYPEVRLALLPGRRLGRMIDAFAPDTLHVATEGPLGIAAARWARRRGLSYTTSFHTRFPEYIEARTGLPPALIYPWLRRFHAAGSGMMVAAESLRAELSARRFANVRAWSRGVDLDLFQPAPAEPWGLPRPIFVYVGRIAVEKNIGAFLDLDLSGSKIVVGAGPQLSALRRKYPAVRFAGARHGESLARAYAGADALVFPSLTDTFGLVLLEALACGTPIAAFPVTGPKDVLASGGERIGAMDADLRRAALSALDADRAACRAHAERFGWRACAEGFLANLVPIGGR